ncbi:MAG: hypothetical protein AAB305_06300 [Candidatus Zixiibacteriota bacterium]
MRLYIFILVTVVLLFPLQSVSVGDSFSKQWKVKIDLEKDQFVSREPIWLDVVLTNISGDTLRSWGLFPPCHGLWFTIEVSDSVGNPIPYSGPEWELVPKEGFLMTPDETFYDSFELNELFAVKYLETLGFGSLSPGYYFVSASYADSNSDRIGFRVVELSGEEREAERLLLDYNISLRSKSLNSSPNASLQRLFEVYPKSVFAEIAALYVLKYEEFLQRFPNSGNSQTRLKALTQELSPELKREYLDSVMVKYKGTRAARHAEQMLKLLGK